jgi:NACalpha-BTF3-like transcription factor
MAAFAGGPAGGAAAGLILRASKDLLQGEKLSTAVGKSIKTGVYGALAGLAFKELTDNIVDNIATAQNAELDAMEAAMKAENFQNAKADLFADLGMDVDALDGASRMRMSGNLNRFVYSYDTVIPPDMMSQYNALEAAMDSAKDFSPEHYAAAAKFHDFMGQLVNNPEAKNLTAAWDALKEIPKDSLSIGNLETLIAQSESGDEVLKAIMNAGGAAGAAAQGALQTVDDNAKKAQSSKPVDPEVKDQLELDLKGGSTATPVDKNFDKSQKLSDFGPVGDKAESINMEERFALFLAEADPAQGELPLDNPNTMGAKLKRGAKGLASKAAGAVKGAASSAAGAVKQGAKDIGNKVTANKLNKSWKKMGEPTDAGSIANILADAGLSSDDIKSIGQEQKVDLPAPAASAGKTADSETGGTGGDAKGGAGVTGGDAKGGAGVTGGDAKGDAGTNTTQADGGSNADTASTSGGQGASGSAGASAGNAGASAGERRASDEEIAKWVKGDAKLVDPKNPAVDGAIEANRDGKNIGLVRQTNGQDHIWLGQSWVNMATGKSASADTKGLGRPDLEELAKEITKANVAKLVKDQLTAPGVKAGTKQAQVTKTMTSKAAAGARTTRPGERFR